MTAVSEYARLATSMSTTLSIIQGLSVRFAEESERTPVDDLMIDAFLASSQELITAAEGLKQVTFQPPAEG